MASEAYGDGWGLQDMPWWARLLIYVGPISAAFLYMLWFITHDIKEEMHQQTTAAQAQASAATTQANAAVAAVDVSKDILKAIKKSNEDENRNSVRMMHTHSKQLRMQEYSCEEDSRTGSNGCKQELKDLNDEPAWAGEAAPATSEDDGTN